MSNFIIPVIPKASQKLTTILNGVTYQLRLLFAVADNSNWLLDINDAQGNPIVTGIPLLPNENLLAQYGYLNFNGGLFVMTNGGTDHIPQFDDLGINAFLLWSQ